MKDEVIEQARDLIAGFIVNRRKQLGYSQQATADRAGLGLRTVQRIEAKHFLPDMKTLLKLCQALDCYFFFAEKESSDDLVEMMRNR